MSRSPVHRGNVANKARFPFGRECIEKLVNQVRVPVTQNAPGGLSLVGEHGPELLNIPKGGQVIPTMGCGIMEAAALTATSTSQSTRRMRMLLVWQNFRCD
jgi:hypothetical protein